MNFRDANECKTDILDVIEALRANVPEVTFELKTPKFSEDNYHIEVIAAKKYRANYGVRVKRDQEIFTQSYGKLMSSSRIFNMAKKLGAQQIDELHKDFIEGLK